VFWSEVSTQGLMLARQIGDLPLEPCPQLFFVLVIFQIGSRAFFFFFFAIWDLNSGPTP
jgi:hypothetical protein